MSEFDVNGEGNYGGVPIISNIGATAEQSQRDAFEKAVRDSIEKAKLDSARRAAIKDSAATVNKRRQKSILKK